MKTGVRLSEIRDFLKDTNLIYSHSGGDPLITGIQSVDACGPGDMVFVDRKDFVELVKARRPSAAVVTNDLASSVEDCEDLGVLIATNIKLTHAIIKAHFSNRDFQDTQWKRIHPSATVHQTASIADTAFISPNAVIGSEVAIGEHTRILGGVVVENGAVIGDHCIIHPNAVIGYNCRIGNHVEIGACTVIGSEGYGFAQDASGKHHKIPQTGIVVIEDNVRIGANNCIDRATYADTRIGAGTKIDNLCHIAHNVQIGEDCLLTAMLCVAGSTKIGNRVVTSGQAGVLDHVTICDDVYLLHRAGVSKDIKNPGIYAGIPVQPLNQYMRNMAHQKNIGALKDRVAGLERELKQLKEWLQSNQE